MTQITESVSIDRPSQIKQLHELETQLAAAADRKSKRVTALEADVARAQRALDDILKKFNLERVELFGSVGSLESQVASVKRALRRSADPKIEAAVAAVRERLDRQRSSLNRTDNTFLGHSANGRPVYRCRSNQKAVGRLLEAISASQEEFDQLKFVQAEDVERGIAAIEARIERCYESLDEFEEVM